MGDSGGTEDKQMRMDLTQHIIHKYEVLKH